MSTEEAINPCIAARGISIPIKTIVSKRLSASRHELACIEDTDPLCPV